MRIQLLALVLFLIAPASAIAHGGGLDANGCHTNRKTGDYHCHRAPAPPRAASNVAPRAAKGDVYYGNCDAARAAGAAPVRRGDPGYARHLDRDNDGVGCE
jgi:hypothetical protein